MTDPEKKDAPEGEEKAAETKTPIFGAGATFGSGAGFGGFTGVTATPPAAEGEETKDGEEEECQAEFTPVVQLQEVETTTGEEDEEALLEHKSKLYRYDTENNEWKERALGMVRLLKHKENKKIRLLMRQEKTLKIRANFLVMPGTKLTEHCGSDKAWVWNCVDFSDGEQKVEMFAIRFGTVEKAQEFKTKFDEAMDANAKLFEEEGTEPADAKDEAGDDAKELAKEVEEKAKVEEESKE